MIRVRSTHALAPMALSLLFAACDRANADGTDAGADGQLPPPAAALAREGGLGLESRLELLDAHLGRVIQGGLDEESQSWLVAAEAMTDRLLEEQLASEWLGTGYLVEARLRQIQALADRILAELRRGVQKELILEDVAALRLSVRDLRTQLAGQGNGDAPPLLDSLLAAYANERTGLGGVPAASSTATTETETTEPTAGEATVAPEGGPLGEPIRP